MKKVDWLTDQLRTRDFTVSAIYGDITFETRNDILSKIRTSSSRILITTYLVANGIDVHGVSLVINYDFPHNFEKYIYLDNQVGDKGAQSTNSLKNSTLTSFVLTYNQIGAEIQDNIYNILMRILEMKKKVYILKDWPLTHHLVPDHLYLTICEILCFSRNFLPKDLQMYLVLMILQVGL